MADQTYNLIDLATQQLNVAISCFLGSKSFVSAQTLAGAADHIFVKALSHRGQQNSLESKYETLKPLLTLLHGRPISKQEFIREEYRAPIAVTHMESASEPSVTLDLEDDALWMIVSACHNYDLLGLPPTAKIRKFQDWFDEHVIGLADPPEYVI